MSEAQQQASYYAAIAAAQKAMSQQDALEASRTAPKPVTVIPATAPIVTPDYNVVESYRTEPKPYVAPKTTTLTPAQEQMVRESDFTQQQLYLASPAGQRAQEIASQDAKWVVNGETYNTYAAAEKAANQAPYEPMTVIPQPKESVVGTAIPGPGAGPRPGSAGAWISNGATGILNAYDNVMEIPATYLRELSGKGFTSAIESKTEGNLFGTVAGASTFVGSRLLAGVYEGATFIARPKMWGSLAALPGTVVTALYDPEVKAQLIKSVGDDAPGLLFELAGGLVGGYIIGKGIGKLTESKVTGELPTRTRALEPKSAYDLPEKPYGRQWTMRRESIPVVKEEFSIRDYQVQDAGYGEWSKKPIVDPTGKPTAYIRTGADLIPVAITRETPITFEDVYIPYQKALYGYRGTGAVAGYGTTPYTFTKSGVDISGLGVAGLSLLLNDYSDAINRAPSIVTRPTIYDLITQPQLTRTNTDISTVQDIKPNTITAVIPDVIHDTTPDTITDTTPVVITDTITDVITDTITDVIPDVITAEDIPTPVIPDIPTPEKPGPDEPTPPKTPKFFPTGKDVEKYTVAQLKARLTKGQSLYRVTAKGIRRTVAASSFHEALVSGLQAAKVHAAEVTKL